MKSFMPSDGLPAAFTDSCYNQWDFLFENLQAMLLSGLLREWIDKKVQNNQMFVHFL